MVAQWTASIVGEMHKHKIQKKELAAKMGFTPEYVSIVLNGKKSPKRAEERFTKALAELISERENET